MATPLVLVEKIIEEVALHGRQGCTLEHVWQSVSLQEDVQYQDYILKMLKKRSELTFSSHINSPNKVEQYKTVCVASKALRFRALGFEDASLHSPYFEDPYLQLLERVAAAKGKGVPSPQLAQMLNLDNSSMHFQLQCLIAAGLIMKVKTSNREKGTLISANIAFLPRFAPGGDCFDLDKMHLEQATLKALNKLKLEEAVIQDISRHISKCYVGGRLPFPAKHLRVRLTDTERARKRRGDDAVVSCFLATTDSKRSDKGQPMVWCVKKCTESNVTPENIIGTSFNAHCFDSVLMDVCNAVERSGTVGIPSQDLRCQFGMDGLIFKLVMKRLLAAGELWEMKQQQRQTFYYNVFHKSVTKEQMEMATITAVASSSNDFSLNEVKSGDASSSSSSSAIDNALTTEDPSAGIQKGESILSWKRRRLCESLLQSEKLVDVRVLHRKFQALTNEEDNSESQVVVCSRTVGSQVKKLCLDGKAIMKEVRLPTKKPHFRSVMCAVGFDESCPDWEERLVNCAHAVDANQTKGTISSQVPTDQLPTIQRLKTVKPVKVEEAGGGGVGEETVVMSNRARLVTSLKQLRQKCDIQTPFFRRCRDFHISLVDWHMNQNHGLDASSSFVPSEAESVDVPQFLSEMSVLTWLRLFGTIAFTSQLSMREVITGGVGKAVKSEVLSSTLNEDEEDEDEISQEDLNTYLGHIDTIKGSMNKKVCELDQPLFEILIDQAMCARQGHWGGDVRNFVAFLENIGALSCEGVKETNTSAASSNSSTATATNQSKASVIVDCLSAAMRGQTYSLQPVLVAPTVHEHGLPPLQFSSIPSSLPGFWNLVRASALQDSSVGSRAVRLSIKPELLSMYPSLGTTRSWWKVSKKRARRSKKRSSSVSMKGIDSLKFDEDEYEDEDEERGVQRSDGSDYSDESDFDSSKKKKKKAVKSTGNKPKQARKPPSVPGNKATVHYYEGSSESDEDGEDKGEETAGGVVLGTKTVKPVALSGFVRNDKGMFESRSKHPDELLEALRSKSLQVRNAVSTILQIAVRNSRADRRIFDNVFGFLNQSEESSNEVIGKALPGVEKVLGSFSEEVLHEAYHLLLNYSWIVECDASASAAVSSSTSAPYTNTVRSLAGLVTCSEEWGDLVREPITEGVPLPDNIADTVREAFDVLGISFLLNDEMDQPVREKEFVPFSKPIPTDNDAITGGMVLTVGAHLTSGDILLKSSIESRPLVVESIRDPVSGVKKRSDAMDGPYYDAHNRITSTLTTRSPLPTKTQKTGGGPKVDIDGALLEALALPWIGNGTDSETENIALKQHLKQSVAVTVMSLPGMPLSKLCSGTYLPGVPSSTVAVLVFMLANDNVLKLCRRSNSAPQRRDAFSDDLSIWTCSESIVSFEKQPNLEVILRQLDAWPFETTQSSKTENEELFFVFPHPAGFASLIRNGQCSEK